MRPGRVRSSNRHTRASVVVRWPGSCDDRRQGRLSPGSLYRQTTAQQVAGKREADQPPERGNASEWHVVLLSCKQERSLVWSDQVYRLWMASG
jgi:hypothetical protein